MMSATTMAAQHFFPESQGNLLRSARLCIARQTCDWFDQPLHEVHGEIEMPPDYLRSNLSPFPTTSRLAPISANTAIHIVP